MRRTEFSYRSLHGAPRGRRRLLYATILVILIIGIDSFSGGHIRAGIRFFGSAIWKAAVHSRENIRGTGYFVSHRALAQENASLRSQLDAMREQAAHDSAIEAEYTALRALLHLASSSPRGITAPIVSSLRSSPYGTFSVGAGAGDGIERGDLVLTSGGFVIGRIADVGPETSLVSMLFASGQSIDILVGGVDTLAEGYGGGNARAKIPRDIPVEQGAIVTAPGLNAAPIGIVGHVESSPESADTTLYINLPVNLSALPYVYIAASI